MRVAATTDHEPRNGRHRAFARKHFNPAGDTSVVSPSGARPIARNRARTAAATIPSQPSDNECPGDSAAQLAFALNVGHEVPNG
jgi:hypothetical protein